MKIVAMNGTRLFPSEKTVEILSQQYEYDVDPETWPMLSGSSCRGKKFRVDLCHIKDFRCSRDGLYVLNIERYLQTVL